MKNNDIIVSERNRPYWQIILASLCFTGAFAIILSFMLQFFINNTIIQLFAEQLFISFYLIPVAIGYSSQKRIYIDLKNSKLKPTYEIGPIKIGAWKTIKNYDYVSVFKQLLSDGSYTYQVNLWYNSNRHLELYERQSITDAFIVGFELSEQLNINLLNAVKHPYEWVDKDNWKEQLS
ncbi:hypothetical protein [Mangrovimonas cancribranchiae]|uniref:Uncharacterized protein n=1 Tax=Mangrovimonas cancribranchiae TaxID=3080055 RepID=A0AAU6P7D5_9FLAO